ncbi:UDP-N-acetylenolpyruvoylglucosamine reductase [Tenacibaculum finnmarkense genomovar finnmarkense]|nr:UDP-N-acetylenolpyruvoylglucosamine reductase [Tenacibaculum finnmarkense genomovar finnmarkense]MCG8723919.1 UDP-N-acetylenolpyruvoylglucosamine reductase [Tenacibaculum finnmarkense]MCG8765632.1 UDP-N-acetylenolpyruvoylglucosamine reductase [Tenacibaculum finnmarkense]MCG8778552.1 UDP-N-acetylenolpyruvoylglucosamine reductase [Tenacibaculum finnmarkense]MCM8907043.1 UDP-N-acetylenolpyruvoylglucosamine reductase [Tenacibaculum finnmarkense genomovar finnmarkense]
MLEIDYYRAVINDTKLTKNSPWTPNQKEELINAFKNTNKKYIEFEVRNNERALKNMDLPDNKFTTGSEVRIYKEDVFKIIGDGNGAFDEVIQIFK